MVVLATTVFGQRLWIGDAGTSGINLRLQQLEDCLQKLGYEISYSQGNMSMIGTGSNRSITRNWTFGFGARGEEITNRLIYRVPDSIVALRRQQLAIAIDSIRTAFTDLSKEAMESHQYEKHDDGTDTIEYALVFSDTEAVNFTYKKNAANQAKGLYTHTYEREEVKTSDAIAAKKWRIDIRSMNTMRYGSRMVTPDFYLELRGDTLCSYLPYLGQARVSPMFSPAIGLNFEKPVLSYKESQPKSKKYTQIDIDVRTQEDNYHYVIQLYDSGEAYIRVRSLNRDPISFDGTMTTSQ